MGPSVVGRGQGRSDSSKQAEVQAASAEVGDGTWPKGSVRDRVGAAAAGNASVGLAATATAESAEEQGQGKGLRDSTSPSSTLKGSGNVRAVALSTAPGQSQGAQETAGQDGVSSSSSGSSKAPFRFGATSPFHRGAPAPLPGPTHSRASRGRKLEVWPSGGHKGRQGQGYPFCCCCGCCYCCCCYCCCCSCGSPGWCPRPARVSGAQGIGYCGGGLPRHPGVSMQAQ